MSENRPKQCAQCKNACSIHLSQVVEGKLSKIDLCADCPLADGVTQTSSFDLLGSLGEETPKPRLLPLDALACPQCGFTAKAFKERGRLGCSHCYEVFESKLGPVFANTQKGAVHVGKIPTHYADAATLAQIHDLQNRMQELVSKEEYEEAARVRDQIKALQAPGSA